MQETSIEVLDVISEFLKQLMAAVNIKNEVGESEWRCLHRDWQGKQSLSHGGKGSWEVHHCRERS